MKVRFAALTASTLAAACAGAPQSVSPTGPDFSAVTTAAREAVAKGEIPSVAYALVAEGRILHEGAAGAATPHTPYALASATKPLAATAVMMLAERGQLQLDESALAQLGRKPGKDSGYTVRQLLAHTSGLGTYARIYWKDQAVPARPLMQNFAAYGFTAQPPGTVFEYSNLGYGLLGELVEKRTGKPLGQFLAQELFAPLGMKHTSLETGFAVPAGAAPKMGADGKPLAETLNDTPAAGNVYASAHDLALFAAFSLGAETEQPVLSGVARDRMQAPAETAALHPYYGGAGYGLGWYVQDLGTERAVWHEGGMPGASSIILMLPQRGLAAVALINANDVNTKAQQIASQLLRAVAPDVTLPSFVPTEGFGKYGGQPELRGLWSGEIEVDGQRQKWALEFAPDGAVRATFPAARGRKPEPQTAYNTFLHGDLLLATFPGRIPARDVVGDGFVLLRLVRRGDELSGMAVAYSAERRLEHLYPFRGQLLRETAALR